MSVNGPFSFCGQFVDKSFCFAELTNISSVTICKKPPENEKVESTPLPLVQFVTPRNRALGQIQIVKLPKLALVSGKTDRVVGGLLKYELPS